MRSVNAGEAPPPSFDDDESAARYFLHQLLARDARPALRGLRAMDEPGAVPDVRVTEVTPIRQTRTKLVKFEQVRNDVPVFGANAIVELGAARDFVSANAELTQIGGVSPVPGIKPDAALASISALTKTKLDIDSLAAPQLIYYYAASDNRWHLAYFFRSVPAAPEEFLAEAKDRRSFGHGRGSSPRERYPRLDYIVDAHDGTVLNYYSATPMATAPTQCRGTDENGALRRFMAVKVPDAGAYELQDPIRSLKTFDLGGKFLDDDTPVPAQPVRNGKAVWNGQFAGAVSAHVNAARVYHFYSSVLYRDSVDDHGMELLSIVNCAIDDPDDPAPEWHNAVWWRNAMWYGQAYDGAKTLRSWSRYLDVIAHELTHGVTERTADLIYQDESGALNESFSDIFGIIIANWADIGGAEPVSVKDWVWELGSGLGAKGLPLRDLSDPKRTGDPDHMKDYLQTSKDNGGVHTNSNIHNKAAHNVLTSRTKDGDFLFTPREAATLYYLTLQRLSSSATFLEARDNLITVTETYYPDAAERDVRTAAIRDAYERVGITK